MSPRKATRYMYWFGEKIDAGDTPTEEEWDIMREAKQVTLGVVKRYMRLEPKDWEYTPGEPFK